MSDTYSLEPVDNGQSQLNKMTWAIYMLLQYL